MDFLKAVAIFFKEGGFFLWPLAIIFVVGVAIAHDRSSRVQRLEDSPVLRGRQSHFASLPAIPRPVA